jgi:hypothetical protein
MQHQLRVAQSDPLAREPNEIESGVRTSPYHNHGLGWRLLRETIGDESLDFITMTGFGVVRSPPPGMCILYTSSVKLQHLSSVLPCYIPVSGPNVRFSRKLGNADQELEMWLAEGPQVTTTWGHIDWRALQLSTWVGLAFKTPGENCRSRGMEIRAG